MAFVINSYRSNNPASHGGKEHHLLTIDLVADGAVVKLSRHINLPDTNNETLAEVSHELYADELRDLADHLLKCADECESRRITKNRDFH